MSPSLRLEEYDHGDPSQRERLASFCRRCEELGISNNRSFQALKLEEFRDRPLKYWVAVDEVNGAIVGTAGCHWLPELGDDYFRILFRGCILPEYRGAGSSGLSKSHRNSFLFRYATPLQIEWARALGGRHFVITTNVEVRGGAASTDRLFHTLERQKVVRKILSEEWLFSTRQNVWELCGPV
jgi:hypothetical protein